MSQSSDNLKLVSGWGDVSILIQHLPQPTDLNREPLRCDGTEDSDHRCADLQQLHDANMLLWTKISLGMSPTAFWKSIP